MVQSNSTMSAPLQEIKILDVGCGANKYPGAVGMDNNPRTAADVIHDLGLFPYPFDDNAFDLVISRHVLEHVPDPMGFVTELHRITRPGGKINLIAPHYSNPDWATDLTHRNHLSSYSFNCFVEGHINFPFYTDVRLKPVRVYVSLANLWRSLGLEFITNLDQRWPGFRFTRKFWEFYLCNIIRGKELHFEFEVLK